MKKVAIGLSGGVDSAVSAALLKKQGYDLLGVFLWCYQTHDFPCTTDQDRAMAVKVADHIGIPLKIIDLRTQYRRSVVDYFFSEYQKGRTPNPDVMCNKEIKFGLFYQQMIEKEKFDFVATGHYAQIKTYSLTRQLAGRSSRPSVSNSKLFLAKGVDDSKDQSYFLYTLKEEQLEHILFPVGGLNKVEARKLAKEFKLPNSQKPDSQGICFVGEVDIKKFLSTKLKIQKGNVLDSNGNVIGQHDGVWFYTIGQRHGFQITDNSKQLTNKKPLYVLSKNSERNELVVGEKEECYSSEFEIENVHWINSSVIPTNLVVIPGQAGIHTYRHPELVSGSISIDSCFHRNDNNNLTVRIRHLGEMYGCRLKPITNNSFLISLDKPAFAIAAGQSAVIYNKDIVLGGGIIK